MDFVTDQLCDERRFRSLTIVDIYTRESLAIEVGQSLRGEDVVRVLNRLKEQRGVPKLLFVTMGLSSPVRCRICGRIGTA
jgi:putative transposase